jgi:hypothetical protein
MRWLQALLWAVMLAADAIDLYTIVGQWTHK